MAKRTLGEAMKSKNAYATATKKGMEEGKVGKNLGLAVSKNERRAMTNKGNAELMMGTKGVFKNKGIAKSIEIDEKERKALMGDEKRMKAAYKKDKASKGK